jgi:hypothetical protein
VPKIPPAGGVKLVFVAKENPPPPMIACGAGDELVSRSEPEVGNEVPKETSGFAT